MKKLNIVQLQKKANALRQDVIKMLVAAGSGHSAGPLDLAEFFATMYFNVLNHNPQKPMDKNRDRLFLSCGHVAPIRYAAMMHAGYIKKSLLGKLRKFGSPLQGHPSYNDIPALESSSGPLGQGYSVAVGAALAGKLRGDKNFVYLLTSDGEHNEGQAWEAIMSAAKFHLGNLIVFVDRNNIQIDGNTEDVMPLESLRAKYEAFNWHVMEIDGHNPEQIIDACEFAKAVYERPTVIILRTIPGKGVSFMEYDYKWHGKPPKLEEARIALKELRTLGGKISHE